MEKEIRNLTKNMSRSERKEFEKRQRQVEDDCDWDTFIMMEVFIDD